MSNCTTYLFGNAGLDPFLDAGLPCYENLQAQPDGTIRFDILAEPTSATLKAIAWCVHRWNGRDFVQIYPAEGTGPSTNMAGIYKFETDNVREYRLDTYPIGARFTRGTYRLDFWLDGVRLPKRTFTVVHDFQNPAHFDSEFRDPLYPPMVSYPGPVEGTPTVDGNIYVLAARNAALDALTSQAAATASAAEAHGHAQQAHGHAQLAHGYMLQAQAAKPSQRTTTTALSHTFGFYPEQYSVQVAVPSNVDCTLGITGTGSFNFGTNTPTGGVQWLYIYVIEDGELLWNNEHRLDTILVSLGSRAAELLFQLSPPSPNIGVPGGCGAQSVYMWTSPPRGSGANGTIGVLGTNMVHGETYCIDFKMTMDITATTTPAPIAGTIVLGFALTVPGLDSGSITGTCKLTRAE